MFLASGLMFVFEILGVIFLGWYLYFRHCVTYWEKKGVPTLSPSFPTGNLGASLVGSENLYVHLENIYRRFKQVGHKHGGIYFFNTPIYVPIDPALIKRILVNDFEYFTDRGSIHDEVNFPLTANIFSQTGKRWKELRTSFSPSFTAGKLKTMYTSVFMENSEKLIKVLQSAACDCREISIRKYLSMFTADIIASSALGFEFDILNNPNQEITRIIESLIDRPLRIKMKTFLTRGFSRPGDFFKSLFDNAEAQEYFGAAIRQTIKYRKDNGIAVNDFFDALVKLDGISWNEIVGQAFIFFVAGHETSASTVCNCLHLLAHHQDIQDKLREEIHTNLGDLRQFTYDGLTQLVYLDKVLKETMRLLPAGAILLRECGQKYSIPGTNTVIDKGTPVIIPLLGIQRDPEYFSDPLTFNPDRFDEECLPFSFMPFGEGQRICIGIRHGQLQTKMGVASVISKFKILPSEKTPRHPEFEKIPSSPLLLFKDEIFVRLEPL